MKTLESTLRWMRRGNFAPFEEQFPIFEKELKKLANCLSQFCQKFIDEGQMTHLREVHFCLFSFSFLLSFH